jgi:hypothetical protein
VPLAGPQASPTRADVPRAGETRGGEEGAPEYFSGHESVEGVIEEIKEKQGE